MKKIFLFLLLFIASASLSAQRNTDPPCGFGSKSCNSSTWSDFFLFNRRDNNDIIKVKLEYIHGWILNHEERVSPLIENPVNGAEIALEFPKYGGKPWHFYYAFPTVGLGLMYLDLGNPDLLGSAVTLYPYINIPIFQTQMFSFNFKLGAGASYVTERYNPAGPQNYKENNFAIGSHLNGFLCAGVNTEILLSKSQRNFISRFSLTADAGLHHISNGSVQKPNAGLNMFNLAAGIKYSPHLTLAPMRSGLSRMERRWSLEPVIGIGANQQDVSDSRKYLNASFSLGGYRPLTNVYRFGVNIDMFYNKAFYAERTSPEYYAGLDNKLRGGFSLANELMFGDFATGVHVGVYTFNTIEHDKVYFKLVGKYRIYDSFFINLALKANMEVAECLEIGVGYSLSSRPKAPYSWMPEKQKKTKKNNGPKSRTPKMGRF